MHLIYLRAGKKRKEKEVLTINLTLVVCHIDLSFSKGLQVIYRMRDVKDGNGFSNKIQATKH